VVAYNLARQFDEKGLEIDFIFGISKKHFVDAYQEFSTCFSGNVRLIPIVKNPRSERSYRASLDSEFIISTKRVVGAVLDHPDVIQLVSPPSSNDFAIPLLAWLEGVPSVVRLPGWLAFEAKSNRNLSTYQSYLFYRATRPFFTKVVCNSDYLKNKTILEGVNPERIEVIPNGVDYLRFRNAKGIGLTGDPALLYVGRLEPSKGIQLLVEGMKYLERLLPSAVLHVVGDGSLSDLLKHIVRREGLDRKVILHGKLIDTTSFYASADICVFPSWYEPFGITSIEAMAAGKPMIATNRGGLPEHVEDFENGLLTEPTKHAFIDAIVRLWRDKNLMEKMSNNNLEKAKDFDWARVAERWVQLFERLT
jgi:glycosyltransferase involved in cell wall biosynthesis